MTKNILRIATRKSPLALWQTHHVRDILLHAYPELQVELVEISTQGDKILDVPLAKIGGKGLFVKELENGLLDGSVDIAVHSMKDVAVDFPEGLILPVILQREDPFDAFVSNHYANFAALPQGAIVGTSSLRRQCQILACRPDLKIHFLRGNVGTRLKKLDSGDYDAIILASAGLKRLGLAARIREIFTAKVMLPAIAQGAIGIECRQDDVQTQELIARLNHIPTQQRITAERGINKCLEGGCQVPIAGFAEHNDTGLTIRGLVGDVQGTEILHSSIQGSVDLAEELGLQLGKQLLALGAGRLLKAICQS